MAHEVRRIHSPRRASFSAVTAATLTAAAVLATCAVTALPASPGASAVTAPAALAPAAGAARVTAGVRDERAWPFDSRSIWNTPLGTRARFLPLRLTPPRQGYDIDETYLVFSPRAPLRRLVDRGYWWPWRASTLVRGQLRGRDTGVRVRVPDTWIVPPPATDELPNRASAALQADGRAREFQYTVRPRRGSDLSIAEGARAATDLRGTGLTVSGRPGAHGGSGMTAIGGTIRVGELTGRAPIRHALAVTMNMAKWGTPQAGRITDGYRWPAVSADEYYADRRYGVGYGTIRNTGGSPRAGLGMGTLLAIPPNVSLRSLRWETRAGAKLAWTYQNYGAYVVDDAADPKGQWDQHLLNVEAGVLVEAPFIATGPRRDTPFGRDMDKIIRRLAVVDDNSPRTPGGAGARRHPLAPPLPRR